MSKIQPREKWSIALLVAICVFISVYYKGLVLLLYQYVYYRACEIHHVPFWPGNKTFPMGHSEEGQRMQAQAQAATYIMYLTMASSLTGLLSTLPLGFLSDRHGRKPIFYVALLGSLVQVILLIFTVQFNLPMWCLILGNVATGVCGNGFMTIIMLCFISLIDLTISQHPQSSSQNDLGSSNSSQLVSSFDQIPFDWIKRRFLLICCLDVVIRICAAFSVYIVASNLIADYGFKAAVFFLFANILFAGFCACLLPETNRRISMRHRLDESHLEIQADEDEDVMLLGQSELSNKWRSRWTRVKTDISELLPSIDKSIVLGILVIFLVIISEGDDSVDSLYLQNTPISWHSKEVGIFAGLNDLGSASVAALIAVFLYSRDKKISTGVVVRTNSIQQHSLLNTSLSNNGSKPGMGRVLKRQEALDTTDINEQSTPLIPPVNESRERLWKLLVVHNSYLVSLFLMLMILSRSFMAIASVFESRAGRLIAISLRLIFGSSLFMCIPLLRTILSLIASGDQQGKVFACISVAQSIAKLLGESSFPRIYEASLRSKFIGVIYILVAGIGLVNLGLSILLSRSIKRYRAQ